MSNSSQSRHFALHWLDRPQTWLNQLSPSKDVEWSWLVSHHQLLTLAKRAERQVGLSILWFSVTDQTKSSIALGALLPGDRVALIAQDVNHADDAKQFRSYLKTKIKIGSVMGTRSDLVKLGFVAEPFNTAESIERQISWGKRLTLTPVAAPTKTVSDFSTSPDYRLTSRRASEADRALLGRWGKIFASETDATTEGTSLEVAEWLKRGRLLIFENAVRPIGMAALSGEYTDRKFGRSCRLSLLFVDPIHRGRGCGRQAVEAIEHEARLENASGLVLYSIASNPRIKNFYSDLGFKESDEWIEVGLSVSTTG